MSRVEQFGVHIMIDGYGADEGLLGDAHYLRGLLDTLPAEWRCIRSASRSLLKSGR